MPRSLLALVLSALLLVGFGGCGGDGDEPVRSSGPVTKAEYVRAFKAVVTSAERENKAARGESQEEQARATIDSQNDAVKALDALRPPAEARRAHANFVAGLRGYVDYRLPRHRRYRARRRGRGQPSARHPGSA